MYSDISVRRDTGISAAVHAAAGTRALSVLAAAAKDHDDDCDDHDEGDHPAHNVPVEKFVFLGVIHACRRKIGMS